MYQELRGTLGRVDSMVAEIQAGHGTAGKLLKDEAMYDELRIRFEVFARSSMT